MKKRIVLQWINDTWFEISLAMDQKLFKSCGISNALVYKDGIGSQELEDKDLENEFETDKF